MDTLTITLIVSVLTVIITVAVIIKLQAWQNRQMFWLLIREALSTRLNVLTGIVGMLVYIIIDLIGGKHVYYFYGRLVWGISISEVITLIITALLVGLVFALFPYSLKKLGIIKSQNTGWSAVGTILAVIVSFCP
jgi:hypothetical protein